jgi:hypothetical protein
MPPQSSGPTGHGEPAPGEPGQPAERSHPGEPGRPASDGWPDDDWPHDDWPDDEPDPSWPDAADRPTAAGGAGSGAWRRPFLAVTPEGAGSGGWRRRFLAVAAVAVAAAAAGAGIALVASSGPSSSLSPAAAQSTSPTPFTVPGQAGPSGGIPGGELPSGAVARLILGGKVLAVSRTSITIGGGGHSEVAAVTRATRFTGRARGIGSVKVGDMIAAEMTMSGGQVTAVTIQDPAEARPTIGTPGVS